jgi:D-alanyl-D-alanine carboxypeptidase
MCADSGRVLYESNAHTRHYPASLVKVMTALIVLENVTDLDEVVTFSERAVDLPWYAASMGLMAGDTLTVWEALHGILLPSANEVANALAEYVAGSVEDFVEMMNRRAYELGAVNTPPPARLRWPTPTLIAMPR